jgi:uncharacterized metal-binding protein YceD (DUF177 family)
MDLLADYRIPFVGLKPGKHEFQMRVDPEFFACFPHSDVDQVHGHVHVELDKLDVTMTLWLELDAQMAAPCDRCLEDITIPLTGSDRISIRFGEETSLDDELWILGTKEYELDLSEAIFQLVHLARPNRVIHENEDDCDLDMTEWQDDTPEGGNHDDDIDPRWEALKGLDN